MKTIRILLIIGIIILMLMNSCSLLIDGYTREIGYNSICWEDNDHILVYAKIRAYDDYTTIGGDARKWVWGGGEIWRIDVNTGEKELLMRKKEWKYAIGDIEIVNIRKSNNSYYINDWFTTYKIREDFSGWDSIGNYIFANYSNDGNTLIALFSSNEYEDQIRRYDLINNTYENIYTPSSLVKNLDYDYDRNLLLINNIKLVDLNTGEETVLLEHGETISGHTVYSPDGWSRYGQLIDDFILIDVYSDNDEYSKVFINIDSLIDKRLVYGLKGIESPDGNKYASGEDNGVEIRNSYGTLITKVIFDNSGL